MIYYNICFDINNFFNKQISSHHSNCGTKITLRFIATLKMIYIYIYTCNFILLIYGVRHVGPY